MLVNFSNDIVCLTAKPLKAGQQRCMLNKSLVTIYFTFLFISDYYNCILFSRGLLQVSPEISQVRRMEVYVPVLQCQRWRQREG